MITRKDDRLQVSGNVTIATVSALLNEALKLQGESWPDGKVLVDFAGLEKMDSSAVSLMLVWVREAQRSKMDLHFANVPANLMSLAKLYGVAELLPVGAAE